MDAKNQYIRTMQAKLTEWDAEIQILTIKASVIKSDVASEYDEMIASLKERLAAARLKTEELQKAGVEARTDLQKGLDTVWSSIGDAVEAARSRFK